MRADNAKAALSELGTRDRHEPTSRVLTDTGPTRRMLRKQRVVVDSARPRDGASRVRTRRWR